MATIEERLKQYEDSYAKARQYDPNRFQNDFERTYGEATNYNKDLIEEQSRAMGELQSVAPTLRDKYSNSLITDPSRQMALIAQARQAPITQWGTAANLLTQRGNRYQDILGKALGGYQTSAEQANLAAENAWRLYQDAIQQDQFNRQLRSSGGGGGGIDFSSLFDKPGPTETVEEGGNTYEVNENPPREKNLTNMFQDVIAKPILDYQKAPNAFQKYLTLLKGSTASMLGGPAGMAAYGTAVAPSVWSDIKGLFNRK